MQACCNCVAHSLARSPQPQLKAGTTEDVSIPSGCSRCGFPLDSASLNYQKGAFANEHTQTHAQKSGQISGAPRERAHKHGELSRLLSALLLLGAFVCEHVLQRVTQTVRREIETESKHQSDIKTQPHRPALRDPDRVWWTRVASGPQRKREATIIII